MDEELRAALVKVGVRDEVIEILEKEELDTVELLQSVSDELLKALSSSIKAGQIVRIRKAMDARTTNQETPTNSTCQPPSLLAPPTTLPSVSMGSSSLPSTPSSSKTSPASLTTPVCTSTPGSTMTVPAPPPSGSLAHSFAIKERGKSSKNWIQTFKLPELFAPTVMEGLKAGHLSGNARDEFSRNICTAMMVHTLYPSPAEKDRVVAMMLARYPFLADTLGAGVSSWQKSMTNYFKNKRRKPKDKTSVRKDTVTPGKESPPAFKKRRMDNELPSLPDGETNETCLEHVTALKKEMAKVTNRNQENIKELMKLTFPFRRQSLLLGPERAEEVLTTYPALQLISELKAEFGRILGDKKVVKDAVGHYKALQAKVLQLASKNSNKNLTALIKNMHDELEEHPENKAGIESSASALALQLLLKERSAEDNLFFKICLEDEVIDDTVKATRYPRLIGCGELGSLDPFVIAAEGKIVAKLDKVTVPMAVVLLVGVFYIFNIEYTPGVRGVYAFLEAMALDRPQLAKKRVAVNKLIKELEL